MPVWASPVEARLMVSGLGFLIFSGAVGSEQLHLLFMYDTHGVGLFFLEPCLDFRDADRVE